MLFIHFKWTIFLKQICLLTFPHMFGYSHTHMYVVITKHVGSYQHRMVIPTHVWFFPHIWLCGNNQTCVDITYFCLVCLEQQVTPLPDLSLVLGEENRSVPESGLWEELLPCLLLLVSTSHPHLLVLSSLMLTNVGKSLRSAMLCLVSKGSESSKCKLGRIRHGNVLELTSFGTKFLHFRGPHSGVFCFEALSTLQCHVQPSCLYNLLNHCFGHF